MANFTADESRIVLKVLRSPTKLGEIFLELSVFEKLVTIDGNVECDSTPCLVFYISHEIFGLFATILQNRVTAEFTYGCATYRVYFYSTSTNDSGENIHRNPIKRSCLMPSPINISAQLSHGNTGEHDTDTADQIENDHKANDSVFLCNEYIGNVDIEDTGSEDCTRNYSASPRKVKRFTFDAVQDIKRVSPEMYTTLKDTSAERNKQHDIPQTSRELPQNSCVFTGKEKVHFRNLIQDSKIVTNEEKKDFRYIIENSDPNDLRGHCGRMTKSLHTSSDYKILNNNIAQTPRSEIIGVKSAAQSNRLEATDCDDIRQTLTPDNAEVLENDLNRGITNDQYVAKLCVSSSHYYLYIDLKDNECAAIGATCRNLMVDAKDTETEAKSAVYKEYENEIPLNDGLIKHKTDERDIDGISRVVPGAFQEYRNSEKDANSKVFELLRPAQYHLPDRNFCDKCSPFNYTNSDALSIVGDETQTKLKGVNRLSGKALKNMAAHLNSLDDVVEHLSQDFNSYATYKKKCNEKDALNCTGLYRVKITSEPYYSMRCLCVHKYLANNTRIYQCMFHNGISENFTHQNANAHGHVSSNSQDYTKCIASGECSTIMREKNISSVNLNTLKNNETFSDSNTSAILRGYLNTPTNEKRLLLRRRLDSLSVFSSGECLPNTHLVIKLNAYQCIPKTSEFSTFKQKSANSLRYYSRNEAGKFFSNDFQSLCLCNYQDVDEPAEKRELSEEISQNDKFNSPLYHYTSVLCWSLLIPQKQFRRLLETIHSEKRHGGGQSESDDGGKPDEGAYNCEDKNDLINKEISKSENTVVNENCEILKSKKLRYKDRATPMSHQISFKHYASDKIDDSNSAHNVWNTDIEESVFGRNEVSSNVTDRGNNQQKSTTVGLSDMGSNQFYNKVYCHRRVNDIVNDDVNDVFDRNNLGENNFYAKSYLSNDDYHECNDDNNSDGYDNLNDDIYRVSQIERNHDGNNDNKHNSNNDYNDDGTFEDKFQRKKGCKNKDTTKNFIGHESDDLERNCCEDNGETSAEENINDSKNNRPAYSLCVNSKTNNLSVLMLNNRILLQYDLSGETSRKLLESLKTEHT